MSLARREGDSRIWKCDNCKKEGVWGSSWSHYGSQLHIEESPEDLLTACSDVCMEIIMMKVDQGKFVLPKLKSRGYTVKWIKDRQGY